MTLQDYEEAYSDFHKEAYGFRPRYAPKDWTLADWEKEWEILHRTCEANQVAEAAAERKAIAEFETRIVKLISMGAADRETAIRWIEDAEQASGSELCYVLGLPYGYFKALELVS